MLLFSIILCGILGVVISRRQSFTLPSPPWWGDLLILTALAMGGTVYAFHLHHWINPTWNPTGQDWHDFALRALSIQSWGGPQDNPYSASNRYLFYPWLGLKVAEFDGTIIALGLMKVTITAAGLLPAALYYMGKQLAPMPVALAGALVVFNCPVLLEMLGIPTEYIVYTLVNVLCLGVGVSVMRSGGAARSLALGLCLTALMVTGARAFSVLVLALPAALVATVWHGRKKPLRAAVWLALLAAPLVAGWTVISRVDYQVLSLETLVLKSVRDQAGRSGHQVMPPPGLGWDASSGWRESGYWRVGDKRALLNLHQTIKFFVSGPQNNLHFNTRLGSNLRGLEEVFPVLGWLLLLIIPGCMMAGNIRTGGAPARQWIIPRIMAAGYASAFVASMMLGMLSTVWITRYSLSLLVLLPTLLLAGVVALFRPLFREPRRDAALYWWPLLLAVILNVAIADHPWSVPRINKLIKKQNAIRTSQPEHDFLMMIADLEGDIGVVDLSILGEIPSLIPARMLIHPGEQGSDISITRPHRRRFVITPCLFERRRKHPHVSLPNPDRLVRRQGCIYEDKLPERPLTLQLWRCVRCPKRLERFVKVQRAPAEEGPPALH